MTNYISRLREGLSGSIRNRLSDLGTTAYIRAADLAFGANKFARHPLGRLSVIGATVLGVASLAEAQGYFETMYGDVTPTFKFNDFAGDLTIDSPPIDLSVGDEVGSFMNDRLVGINILEPHHVQDELYGSLRTFGEVSEIGDPIEFRFFDLETGLECATEQFGSDAPATFFGDGRWFADLDLNIIPEPATIAPAGIILGYIGLKRRKE